MSIELFAYACGAIQTSNMSCILDVVIEIVVAI
jgi:hypothetical protein